MKHFFSLLALAVTLFTALNAIDANAAWRPWRGSPGWNNPGRPGPTPGHGGGGWNNPGRPGNGGGGWNSPGHGGGHGGGGSSRVTCQANDKGWEEHFGGHGSCQECLARHGKCVETCSTQSFSCKAEGNNYNGYTETFESYGSDEYYARDEALNRCYRMGARNCRSVGCDTNTQIVSSRRCN